jgi:hypothetical protein
MNLRALNYHLVGAGEQGRRDVNADRLSALRLMTSSYSVGACTGRSAGFLTLEDAIDRRWACNASARSGTAPPLLTEPNDDL